MTLSEFLLARIAEDEAMLTIWHTLPDYLKGDESEIETWENNENDGLAIPEPRLAAECYVKRQIVALHPENPYDDNCRYCLHSDDVGWPCTTLRLLALPYAGHPDYLEEWKP